MQHKIQILPFAASDANAIHLNANSYIHKTKLRNVRISHTVRSKGWNLLKKLVSLFQQLVCLFQRFVRKSQLAVNSCILFTMHC